MKLTRRQESFMRQLLALYAEAQEPIHYSALAERIGVSRITAYDMLRVLEQKGYAESVYQLTPTRGPGRSTVLYRPTPKARQAILELAAEANAPDWSTLTEDIIHRMGSSDMDEELRSITFDLLARIPPEGPPEIRYCTELITIIALNLRHSKQRDLLCRYVSDILGDAEKVTVEGLNVLAGISLGLFMAEKSDEPEWNRELLDHVTRYHQLVSRMGDGERRRLAQNLQAVLALMASEETPA